VRDRRAGGGATVSTPWGRAGAEVIKAWGIGDRGDAEGLEVGGWLDARIVERVFVARAGRRSASPAADACRRSAVRSRSNRGAMGGAAATASGSLSIASRRPGRDAATRRRCGDATIAMLIVSALAPLVLD